MQEIEQTLDSREVAEMVGKDHAMLLRDLRRYIKQMNEVNKKDETKRNLAPSDFFQESTYKDSTGRTLPCYDVTKKGCEFIAHKLTGTKGTEFTARYINRFHEMEGILSQQKQEPELELPWFIRKFRGSYIILERDFITITGVDIKKHRLFYRREYFTGGCDWNGYGWYTTIDKENFKKEYGFDYGEDECMLFFYPIGVIKALAILENNKSIIMNPRASKLLKDGIEALHKTKKKKLETPKKEINTTTVAEIRQTLGQVNISIVLEEPCEVI